MLVIKLVIDVNLIHFQYEELNKMVNSVQSYLTRTREGLIEAINRLELQVIFIYNISKHMSLLYVDIIAIYYQKIILLLGGGETEAQ